MKRYLLRIFLFFFIVAIVDFIFGKSCDYLYKQVKTGDSKDNYAVFNSITADIIVIGSSRSCHHYNSQILSDSLHLSCFNCGSDGLGIFNMYGRLVSICQRKIPKIVIYDVFAPNELYDLDNFRDLDGLKPFCNDDSISSILCKVNPIEKIKLASRLYRYNTKIFQIVRDLLVNKSQKINGFEPLYKTMDYTPSPFRSKYDNKDPDSLKLKYVYKVIELSKKKKFKLFFSISPWYQATNDDDYTVLKEICKKEGITLINYYTKKDINTNKELFADPAHLNASGADVFSKQIVSFLKD